MSNVKMRVIPALYLSENAGKFIPDFFPGQIDVKFTIESLNQYGILYRLNFEDPSIIS